MLKFLWNKRRDTHHIVFYTKEGCTLCKGVRSTLAELQHEYNLAIEEIDITADENVYQRYKETIPVVIVDGQITLEGRISERDLRRAIQSRR